MFKNKSVSKILDQIDEMKKLNLENQINYDEIKEILKDNNVEFNEQILIVFDAEIPQIQVAMEFDKIASFIFEERILTFIEISV